MKYLFLIILFTFSSHAHFPTTPNPVANNQSGDIQARTGGYGGLIPQNSNNIIQSEAQASQFSMIYVTKKS